MLRDNLLRPIDLEVSPDGKLAYIHITGFSWFGGAAHGIRLLDIETDSLSTIANGFRLSALNGLMFDNDTGRAFWRDRTLLRTHSVEEGSVTRQGFVDIRTSSVFGNGAIYYHVNGGPFGACDTRNNSFTQRTPINATGDVDGAELRVAGGSAGFSDSTVSAPNGAYCQTNNALAYTGNRLYINDAGNNAIRYLNYNDPTTDN